MLNTILRSLIALSLLSGCANTEKYLRPEHTFSNLITISLPAPRKDISDGIYEVCADSESTHSPVIWLPLLGPAIDLTMRSSMLSETIDNLTIFVPLLGPAISYAKTSPRVCVYKTVAVANGENLTKVLNKEEVIAIRSIADVNCRSFLQRFYSNSAGMELTKDISGDVMTIASGAAAFATPVGSAALGVAKLASGKGMSDMQKHFIGGQLYPAIAGTIEQLRQTSNLNSKMEAGLSLAELMGIMNEYDDQCSIERAVMTLNAEKAKNLGDKAKSGNKTSP